MIGNKSQEWTDAIQCIKGHLPNIKAFLNQRQHAKDNKDQTFAQFSFQIKATFRFHLEVESLVSEVSMESCFKFCSDHTQHLHSRSKVLSLDAVVLFGYC